MNAILKYNKNTQKVTVEDDCCDFVIIEVVDGDDELMISFDHEVRPDLLSDDNPDEISDTE
jgi:hypothetical protein